MTARQLRRLALLLALVVGLAGLAGCGDDSDDDAEGTGDETADESADTTEAETADTTGPEAADEGGGGADEEAAGLAVQRVFDSTVAFDDKVASLEGGEAQRADHEAYVGAAGAVGGIAVEPTDVAVNGDTATVTYRVLFAGNEMYRDLSMDVTKVGEAWVVPTDAFCGFLASARTPCATPAG